MAWPYPGRVPWTFLISVWVVNSVLVEEDE